MYKHTLIISFDNSTQLQPQPIQIKNDYYLELLEQADIVLYISQNVPSFWLNWVWGMRPAQSNIRAPVFYTDLLHNTVNIANNQTVNISKPVNVSFSAFITQG